MVYLLYGELTVLNNLHDVFCYENAIFSFDCI